MRNELMEFWDIERNDYQDEIFDDEQKLIRYNCSWCGTFLRKEDIVYKDAGVKLCKLCYKKIASI